MINRCYLLLAVGVCWFARLGATDFTAEWGGAKLTFPLPVGYADATALPLAQVTRRSLPPSNELIGIYTTTDPWIYAMAQGFVPTKARVLSVAEFAEVKQGARKELGQNGRKIRQQLEKAIDQVQQGLTEIAGEGAKIDISKPLIFDSFDESPEHLSFLMLMRVKYEVPGRAESVPVAVSMTIVNLQGKLIYFYFYRKFASKETYAELEKVTRTFMQELRTKNPRP